jgi:peptide/nickel transport system substrate-binding protein
LIVALVIGAIAIAGCGGAGSSSGGAGSSGGSSGTPSYGGTATVGQGEEISSLDPLVAYLNGEVYVSSQISEPLWRENTEGKLVPWLLESAQMSDGAKVWTLHLKKNVKFSTGKPMTSADVLFTLERARKSASWESLLEGITKVTAPNASTIVITNKEPAAELPAMLSQWSFGVVPDNLAGESEKEFSSHPIGTGPFKLVSWKRGEAVTLEKNPYYWMKGRPYLDKLVFKTIADPNSRVTQLEGGELNVAYAVPWSQVESIEDGSETEFDKFQMGILKAMQVNARKPLFQNPKVREALNLGIDREGMVNVVLSGHGEPANSIVTPTTQFHDSSIPAGEHNPEKAKELLAEAVKEGVDPSFTLASPNEDDFWIQADQVLQQNLEEVGFEVKILKLDTSSWFENLETGNYDASTGFIWTPLPTPIEIFGGYNAFEGQYTGAPTTETSKLFNEALTTVSVKKREQLYSQMQEIVNKEEYLLPVVYEPYSWANRTDVTGLYVGRSGIPWFSEMSLAK